MGFWDTIIGWLTRRPPGSIPIDPDKQLDEMNGGGGIIPSIPAEEIEITLPIEQSTIWDSLSAVLAEPVNLLIIAIAIIGGAYFIRFIADRVWGSR